MDRYQRYAVDQSHHQPPSTGQAMRTDRDKRTLSFFTPLNVSLGAEADFLGSASVAYDLVAAAALKGFYTQGEAIQRGQYTVRMRERGHSLLPC